MRSRPVFVGPLRNGTVMMVAGVGFLIASQLIMDYIDAEANLSPTAYTAWLYVGIAVLSCGVGLFVGGFGFTVFGMVRELRSSTGDVAERESDSAGE